MIPPVAGVAVVLASLAGLLALLAAWTRAASPHPEIPRKISHVVMGLVTCSFPWMFRSAGPVLAICGGAAVMLAALRAVAPLRRAAGRVLGGVERVTFGELYFPASVALVFVLAQGDCLLFLIPMLLLTLADSAGALVGVFYGRHTYRATDGRKSVEGSLAVFVTAFLVAGIPLALAGRAALPAALFLAFGIAVLTTALEAAAGGGLDNLLLPLGGLVMLRVFLP